MMKSMKRKSLWAFAALMMVSGTAAAESTDVKVIGTITPGGCNMSLSGGGTLDYGNIDASTLKADDFTVLGFKHLSLNVTCAVPTKFAITAKSGRGASAVAASGRLAEVVQSPYELFEGSGTTDSTAVGLGMQGNKGIGGVGFTVVYAYPVLDADVAHYSDGNTTSWKEASEDKLNMFDTSGVPRYFTWVPQQFHKGPVALEHLETSIYVRPYINRASELDLSRPVKIDGLITMELLYL